jgi:hypothetical protein
MVYQRQNKKPLNRPKLAFSMADTIGNSTFTVKEHKIRHIPLQAVQIDLAHIVENGKHKVVVTLDGVTTALYTGGKKGGAELLYDEYSKALKAGRCMMYIYGDGVVSFEIPEPKARRTGSY